MDAGTTIKINVKDAIDLIAEVWERVSSLVIIKGGKLQKLLI